ncbi:MAG: hypothetical protein NVS3B26_20300 [Mycobacteriales bacterium]
MAMTAASSSGTRFHDRQLVDLVNPRSTALAPVAERIERPGSRLRVRADGKHLSRQGQPFQVKGVTYGTFTARPDGQHYPSSDVIFRDLAAMAELGLNTVRTYSVPPVEMLDMAAELGLYVLVGLHYDDWRMQSGSGRRVHRRVLDSGQRAVDAALERVAGRPEVLAVSIGNEVPADLVRLHRIHAVEQMLGRLVDELHAGDPDLLATYSNFPTTEYLHIPGLDLTCFNVFLEEPASLRAYLRHLLIVAGPTPLLITELGLAAQAHGEDGQAHSLDWQLRLVDETGCAGATVFAWTDEWAVAGEAVDGWGFGITGADRSHKPAVATVSRWASRGLREARDTWPSLSVVVCAYNEDRLLRECLDSLAALDYPDLDVIVCDDGSTDSTLDIVLGYPFRVLDLPHGGLSAARNAGLAVARGEIVAYLDADAHCHPDWPYHLVLSMQDEGVVATGGPNLPVAHAGFTERAVAASPGGPVEVLVSDDRAEHVPGCNMAYRRDALRAIEGFDTVFTSAGDDVDVCWRLLDRGGQIAFAPAAQVRHHRRPTVRAYLKQQRGYGRSEKMVAGRHPHRYNRLGQARWSGKIYGGLRVLPSVLRPVVYHGSLGAAPYQTVIHRRADRLLGWYAALLPLSVPVALLGAASSLLVPALIFLPCLALVAVVAYFIVIARAARPPRGERQRWRWRALVAWLHVAQPFVRTWGRVRTRRLSPLPNAGPPGWTGDRLGWLMELGRELSVRRCRVQYGEESSSHDLRASVGLLTEAELTTAVVWEWTPALGVRYRVRPVRTGSIGIGLLLLGVPLPAVAGLLAAACLGELLLLRGAVTRAVHSTSATTALDLTVSRERVMAPSGE